MDHGRFVALAALAALVAACGESVPPGIPDAPVPATGGVAGGGRAGVAGSGSIGGTSGAGSSASAGASGAGEPRTNCAFPVEGTLVGPVERVATLSEPGCRYGLGDARALPFVRQPDKSFSYAFSFDVNGDGVGDLFFWEWTLQQPSYEYSWRLALAVSRIVDGRLQYETVDCDALAAVPWGRAVARDVDADGAPDLVISVSDGYGFAINRRETGGFVVLLNRPSGFVRVLDYYWPDGAPMSQTALLDVAVEDFDGNGAADVAFGYDRALQRAGASEFELMMGATLFLGQLGREALRGDLTFVEPIPGSGPFITGKLASVPSVAGPPSLYLVEKSQAPSETGFASARVVRFAGSSFDVVGTTFESPTNVPWTYGAHEAWTLPLDSRNFALGLLYEHELRFYEVGIADKPLLAILPTVWEHHTNHELGGGPEQRTRFMVDVEGDGDLDFVELFRESVEVQPFVSVAIHRNSGGIAFEEPALIRGGSNVSLGPAENPFAAVGPARAAIFVNDQSWSDAPPTFQMLECATP